MKIKRITHVVSNEPKKFYDVIDCEPNNNFLIKTNNSVICSHNCALMDEADFSRGSIKGSSALDVKNEIMKTYNAIKERMNSRFIKNGVQYGRLFLVSSKKSDQDFIEAYIHKMKTEGQDKHMLIIDEPQWVIKPEGTFSKEKFPVAVGNKTLKSRILPDELSKEEEEALIKQGYRILWVPVNLKQSFILDVNTALMNLAGISVIGTTTFFNYDMFSKCYSKQSLNPFVSEVLTIGIKDDLQISDFFELEKVPMAVRMMPQFIHVDASLTGDKTGISDVAASGLKELQVYNGTDESIITEMTYKHVFTVAIQAPHGSEVSFEKTRKFIYYLKSQGFNIIGVSLDGFQSADTKQLLLEQGYDASIISLDKSPQGYLALRSAMNDERISLLHLELLEKELIELQRDVQTGKLDHPADGCFTPDTSILLFDTIHNRTFTQTINSLYNSPCVSNYYVQTVRNNEIQLNRIKKVFITKYVDTLLKVTFSDGNAVTCTPEHKFMLEDESFSEIQYISFNQRLKTVNDKILYVTKKEELKLSEKIAVYDLEIECVHNFPLSNGIVVHNSKDCSDSLAGALYNATLHKQSLVDSYQLLSTWVDVNEEEDMRQNFVHNLEQSLACKHSKLAADKLDSLLSGMGSDNILIW